MRKNKLTIRLQRAGKKNTPFFFIVVTRKAKCESGSGLARVGYYDPFLTKGKGGFRKIVIYREILNYWIAKGAIPNDTVQKLLFS